MPTYASIFPGSAIPRMDKIGTKTTTMTKLTQAALKVRIKKPGRHGDGGGLFFRVLPGEKAYWVYRYRIGGQEREMSLGTYPEISLAEARALHSVEYAKV